MKRRIGLTFIMTCLFWVYTMALGIFVVGPTANPDVQPPSEEYTRVAVTRPPSSGIYSYGGSITLRSESGETDAIESSLLYPVAFYFVKKGTYVVDKISINCDYVVCNNIQLTKGSVVTFTNGGYVSFY